MPRRILLARPHPFIATTMTPFLEAQGFEVHRLTGISTLSRDVVGANGVVISLALRSSLAASAEDVFVAVRHVAPMVPIAFAAMLDCEAAVPGIRRVVQSRVRTPTVWCVGDPAIRAGIADAFLYIGKRDLDDPVGHAEVIRSVTRHFGLP